MKSAMKNAMKTTISIASLKVTLLGMKITSLIVILILVLTLSAGLTACGSDNNNGLSIAIVTSLTGIDDRSFNQNNYEGIQAFVRANPGSTVRHVHEPSGQPGAAIQYVENIAGDFDVVVLPGFQFRNIAPIAMDNPDTYFILIDTWPESYQGMNEFSNVRAVEFAEQESGFLAGVTAALESESGRVAFVGGEAFPALVNYQFGFASGVNYANTVFGTSVQLVDLPHRYGIDVRGINIGGNYAGDFNNPDIGYVIANELFSEGVDIIFVAAGGTGLGVHMAVRNYDGNARLIGVDTDQFDDINGNIEITAVYKAMGLNVHRILNSIAEGNFEGGNHTMRTSTNSVGIVLTPSRHQLSAETLNRINELFGLLRDGLIVPASNFNGYTPESFPGLPS